MREKLSNTLSTLFGWLIFIALLAGGLAFFGFVLALILGGETGAWLATFVQTKYLPVIIRVTSLTIGLGLIAMYLSGEQALSLSTEQEEIDEEIHHAQQHKDHSQK